MKRRALTMIELLLALGLLSMVIAAVTSWTQSMARATATLAEPARWHTAAEAVLDLFHDDMMSGDFERKKSRYEPGKPRVETSSNQLEINTRSGGVSHHSYRRDPIRRQLLLVQTDHAGRQQTRLLLDQVGGWECMIDQIKEILTVSIQSIGGQTVTRSFALP